jgi:hypothetical protein
MPRRPTFDKLEHDKIVGKLFESIQEDLESRMEWVEKRVRNFEDWVNPNPNLKTHPWEGASNITPPLIAKAVRALHSRLLGSIFNADPLVHVLPVDVNNREAARVREKFLNEQLRNEIPNFYRELNTALLDMIIHGTSFMMVWYERNHEVSPEWLVMDRFQQLSSGEEVPRTDQELIEEALIDVRSAEALGEARYEVDHIENGFERTSIVSVDRDDVELQRDKVSVTVEKEVVTEGIRVKNLELEDLVFPANATSLQIEDSHHNFRLFWLYPNQVRSRFEKGDYHNLVVEDVERLEKLSGGVHGTGLPDDVTNVKEAKDAYQGVDFVNGTSGIEDGKILVVEAYYPWDTNDDGMDEQMVFTWIPEIKKLATWDFLRVRFGHGRRPFVPFSFVPICGRIYGIGLGEMLEDLQAEAATIINQMNDRENLMNNPTMLVEQNAGISPSVFRNLPPGSAIPVRNVERVRPLEWAKDPHSGIQILQQIYAFSEQIAGIGDISTGVQPNRPNAPRTARGTLALISESNIIVDTHVLNAQFMAFQELLHQIDGLNKQYVPAERVFFVIGEEDPLKITREDFRERVKFFFSGNTANTNIQVKQSLAQFLFQNLISTPLFTGQFVQMPEISIQTLYRLIEHFVREHVPGKDSQFLLPPLEEFTQIAEEVMTAQREGMEEGKARAEEQNLEAAQAEGLLGMLGGGNAGQTQGAAS